MTTSTELYRVAYVSRATQALSRAQLDDLLATAQANNRRDGISGLLVYDAGAFLQVFEGPTDAVEALIRRIERDPRHTSIVVLSAGPVEERYFDGWGMDMANLERVDDTNHDVLRAYMRSHHVGDRATVFHALRLFCEEHARSAGAA
jgi:hypothetical protein